ncbi:MAG TPA: argininosuccinate lyase [Candidatus Eisenbacteria bacterium]|nr:argininosuccinate lyase [Candidatus Eisenbacteria bacterium]
MSANVRARDVWGARLGQGLDPRARKLNDSLPVDWRLWPEELALSRAYAHSLFECGVLDRRGCEALLTACEAVEDGMAAGNMTLVGEDVHIAIESELMARCGDPARRLHTGRSRNDQVATLLRLRVMDLCDHALEMIRELERALVTQARSAGDQAVAAQTHLQPAQPVLLAHAWLAHVAALERDEARFLTAREAADLLPLGAGAIAGTPLRYDRGALAARLGFTRLADNSLDAVSDRDFALEYLNAASLLGLHVSRLAEDLVLGCSPGFGWFRAPAGFSTGSSLLPQKRNPDVFELARAKAARLSANGQRLAMLMKGLPSGYQKDLQEDKEAVFDTGDTLEALLPPLSAAILALEPDLARLDAALTPDLLAVELADALVDQGMAFRDAHALVGSLWAEAEKAGVEPSALPESTRLELSPHFTAERLKALDVKAALARRSHAPGGGAGSVAAQLARHEARLGLGPGDAMTLSLVPATKTLARPASPPPSADGAASTESSTMELADGLVLRRATVADVKGIASLMADYVLQGLLLPRPVSELYQSIREFHVVTRDGQVVACAALRLLWEDLGEVRSLAVRADHHGRGLGQALVQRIVDDARALELPRVIALTRELRFFERCGFQSVARETLPRKVWTDCVRCPRRHACDEIAVVLDIVPGASAAAADQGRAWVLPIPQAAVPPESALPIIG